jgi:outer membrane protein OmpA-like peptidoglycan-associated protein
MMRGRGAIALACLVLAACGAASPTTPVPLAPDTDGDGLVDADDRCHELAEDVDGRTDEDGCPDLDDDADGLVDLADRCPCDVEDLDGFEDEDGCPEPDDDGDTIPDRCDRCPRDPEDRDGDCDADGCPDAPTICLEQAPIRILERVDFGARSATPAAPSEPVLEMLSNLLAGNPQIERVEIVGHATRSEPGAAALARRRAVAVRGALVSRGVDPLRLVIGAPVVEATGEETHRHVAFVILRASGEDWPGGEPPESQRCDPRPAPCADVPACAPQEENTTRC